jgi:hypothetical protein
MDDCVPRLFPGLCPFRESEELKKKSPPGRDELPGRTPSDVITAGALKAALEGERWHCRQRSVTEAFLRREADVPERSFVPEEGAAPSSLSCRTWQSPQTIPSAEWYSFVFTLIEMSTYEKDAGGTRNIEPSARMREKAA